MPELFRKLKKKELIGSLAAGIIFLFFLDRLFKYWVITDLAWQRFSIIKKWLSWELYRNEHLAFGLPMAEQTLLPLISLITVGLLYFGAIFWRRRRYNVGLALLCIALGAMSNLYDRLHYGWVIDYVNVRFLPVFNVADVMIFLGVIWLGYYLLRVKK